MHGTTALAYDLAMKTIIREMKSADLSELAKGYARTLYSNDEPWTDETAYALWFDWLKRQPDLAFVSLVDTKLVGAIVIGVRPWCDGNHLVDGEIFVLPEYQKMSIGSKLLRSALEAAIVKYKPVVWETYTFRNQKFPLQWYHKLGFREIDEWVMIRAEIMSAAEWERKIKRKGTLAEFLTASPLKNSGLNISRRKDRPGITAL